MYAYRGVSGLFMVLSESPSRPLDNFSLGFCKTVVERNKTTILDNPPDIVSAQKPPLCGAGCTEAVRCVRISLSSVERVQAQ